MIKLYTKTQCQHCGSAKQFLQTKNINFQEINVDTNPAAREFLVSQGHRSVPQFYVANRLLVAGGWDQLRTMTTDAIIDLITQDQPPTQ